MSEHTTDHPIPCGRCGQIAGTDVGYEATSGRCAGCEALASPEGARNPELAGSYMRQLDQALRTLAAAPTQHAYDAACAALWKHRERADTAEQERDRARNIGVLLESDVAEAEETIGRLVDALGSRGYEVHDLQAALDRVLDWADEYEARVEDSQTATASQINAARAEAQTLRDTVVGTS